MNETEKKIINCINKIKPFLISDGGDIEFVCYENNIVFIKMLGACSNCKMIDTTLSDGIENYIISEIPEVKKVVNLY